MSREKLKNIFLFFLIYGGLFSLFFSFVFAQESCPSNTQVQATSAILVGEISDDGGDPNLTVWFQYGSTSNYNLETPRQVKTGKGLFCAEITGLNPRTTYYYRAAAQNSAGTSYGEDRSFTTKSLPPTVDLKVNNSDGPLTLPYNSTITLTWTSTDTYSCNASWFWSVGTSGSKMIEYLKTGTYEYWISCSGPNGSARDSVTVTIEPPPLPVINFKVNNSPGPVDVYINDYITLSWNAQYGESCVASGDWSGNKAISGSQSLKMTSLRTYIFTLTCSNSRGESSSSVIVNVYPRPPRVITKPAVVTY